jgi:hypothetical protein
MFLVYSGTLVGDLTDTFLDTIAALFGGIATGIVGVFETLIWDVDTGLTVLGVWMVAFMGFSFALTIFYALLKKVA